MEPSPPPIAPEIVRFVESGVSILVGTRSDELRPDCVRGMGARVEPGGTEVTVFLPQPPAAASLENLAANGRLAVCFARPCDHRSVQLKGQVVKIGPAGRTDREGIQRYRELMVEALGHVGVAPRLIARFRHTPCRAVRFRVEHVFDQTPGPRAGEPLRDLPPAGAP